MRVCLYAIVGTGDDLIKTAGSGPCHGSANDMRFHPAAFTHAGLHQTMAVSRCPFYRFRSVLTRVRETRSKERARCFVGLCQRQEPQGPESHRRRVVRGRFGSIGLQSLLNQEWPSVFPCPRLQLARHSFNNDGGLIIVEGPPAAVEGADARSARRGEAWTFERAKIPQSW